VGPEGAVLELKSPQTHELSGTFPSNAVGSPTSETDYDAWSCQREWMACAQPCPVCGEPGRLLGSDSGHHAIYHCHTPVCDVIQFDHAGLRTRELPPRKRPEQPGVWTRRGARAKLWPG
jgi:hypothetical protein